MVTFEWSDWRNADFWWVQSVYVRPDCRRKGVYRRMYETVLRQARERGDVCGIRLYVERDNRLAQSVYQTLNLCETKYVVWETDFVL
jgi:ribosomal protein S18 acetylase RimI-like enzyme